MYPILNDSHDLDITTARAYRFGQRLAFERARQDRQTYYRLTIDNVASGSLTDGEHARRTIAYWRANGWLCDHVRSYQGITMPSGYCARCGAGPYAVTDGAR